MKRGIRKTISLVLVVAMVGAGIAACSKPETKETSNKEGTVVTEENLEALLSGKLGAASDTDKKETVYIQMDAWGNVINTTVSDVLQVQGKDNISDISNLSNITNISGDEKFATEGSRLVWENKGKDITYQGTITQKAPVDIQISYTLDGKEIAPDQLKGKSGKIEIKYLFTNNTGSQFAPFVALTGMVLNEHFSNISIDNGKITQYDNSNIVVGYAMPGIKKYLLDNISNAQEYIGEANIPEGFVIKADVKDFQMEMALTVITSRLGDFDMEEAMDFSELEEQMNQLNDGAQQLADGSGDVYDGSVDIESAANALNGGAGEIESAVSALDDGAEELESAATALDSGAGEIQSAATALNDGTTELESAATQVNSGAKKVSNGVSTIKSAFEDETGKDGTVKNNGLVSGSKELAVGTKEINKGVQQLAGTLTQTPATIQTQIDGVISQVKAATGGVISNEEALNATVEGIQGAVKGGMELSVVLQSKGLNADAYFTLSQAYYSVQTLKTVKASFQSQIDSKQSDINALLNGTAALETGSAKLWGGITQLYGGVTILNTGAGNLATGTGQMLTGMKQLKAGTKQLKNGSKALASGTGQLKSGGKQLTSGTGQLVKGTGILVDGTSDMAEGAALLADGTKQLRDGAVKLNDEGIAKITKIFGGDAKEAIQVIEHLLNAGQNYKSFSGINSHMSGSVKFIVKTAEIK